MKTIFILLALTISFQTYSQVAILRGQIKDSTENGFTTWNFEMNVGTIPEKLVLTNELISTSPISDFFLRDYHQTN